MEVQQQHYFTELEAAAYLHLSPRTVDNYVTCGELHPSRLGRKLLSARQELDAFVTRHRAPADLDVIVNETLAAFAAGGQGGQQ